MAARGAHDLWLPFLARWGVLLAVVIVGLFTTFFAAFGMVASQPGIGGDHDELLMAAYAPGMYRLAMLFDALGWFGMGGLLVIAGLALSGDSPVRGRLGAALGVTAIAGVIGAFVRMIVVGDLGEQFVAAGADQAAILATTRTVAGIISAHFAAGQLTIGLAFLAVGSAALATSWVPRSIGWLLTLPALTTFVLLAATVVLDVFLFPILLLHVALLVATGLMIARQWWSAPATSAREGATGA
ncbi:MAG: hypothetical protein XU10_C0026G0016 [Chloroflexi bacterium CSP1-4]|nr:MAG: hypothetical protein XU10_C0026G0016 [Chloroflexi bacterium CSP1-4]